MERKKERQRGVDASIAEYVERYILPLYDNFDKGHRRDHAEAVIDRSLALASRMELNPDMVYVIAAFHDLGLANGREFHHLDSGRILERDSFIGARFSAADIRTMKEAVEDHRASGKTEPRSDYGKVVADADRLIDPETIIRRTIQFGLANYPELDREGHFRRTMAHLEEKYAPGGYMKIWLPWGDNAVRLKELHRLIADKAALRAVFDRLFAAERP